MISLRAIQQNRSWRPWVLCALVTTVFCGGIFSAVQVSAAEFIPGLSELGNNFNTPTVKTSDSQGAINVVDWIFGTAGSFVLKGLQGILWFVQIFTSFLVYVIALVFDLILELTIRQNFLKDIKAIDFGWALVRDFSNMFFIFILLFIGISIILSASFKNSFETPFVSLPKINAICESIFTFL